MKNAGIFSLDKIELYIVIYFYTLFLIRMNTQGNLKQHIKYRGHKIKNKYINTCIIKSLMLKGQAKEMCFGEKKLNVAIERGYSIG